MTKKERSKQEIIFASDLFRLTKSAVKEQGYDLTIEEVRAVIDSMVHIIYTCLINGIRVTIPNLGEFYRDIAKGRKAGYYRVPSARDEHTQLGKNMTWTTEYKEAKPDYGKIVFVTKPSVKRQFRSETEGKV